MRAHNLALQRDKYRHLSDDEWRWFIQQAEGRERTADKLPMFAAIDDWWYPVRLSCEQCSSEITARYKASLLSTFTVHLSSFLDLTGGYGVDTFFLSEHFAHTDYVEQDAELCRIAAHNFSLIHPDSISVHHTSSEDFLTAADRYDLIFLDPARRDTHGGKVFRLEDCTPNVIELLPALLDHLTPGGHIMLKLSPMLDITQALSRLATVSWDIHVVAVKNEVKEVLLLSGGTGFITAIDLAQPERAFTFTREEEHASNSLSCREGLEAGTFIYEPNAAILKAGAYKLIGERFGLQKLDANTHLYTSEQLHNDFPGRIWRIQQTLHGRKDLPAELKQANLLTRNYPLTPAELKQKLRLRDGGDTYIIGARICGKPVLLLAERIDLAK